MTAMNTGLRPRHGRQDATQRLEVERAAFLGLAVAVTTALDSVLDADTPSVLGGFAGADEFGAVEYIVEMPTHFI